MENYFCVFLVITVLFIVVFITRTAQMRGSHENWLHVNKRFSSTFAKICQIVILIKCWNLAHRESVSWFEA